MPQSAKRDPRSYRTPGVVNDNLARDLTRRELEERLERSGQLDFDQQYRRVQETNADQLSRQRQARKATVRQAQSIPLGAVVGGAVLAVLAAKGLMTPVNMLLFQLIWMLPGLLVTEWTRAV